MNVSQWISFPITPSWAAENIDRTLGMLVLGRGLLPWGLDLLRCCISNVDCRSIGMSLEPGTDSTDMHNNILISSLVHPCFELQKRNSPAFIILLKLAGIICSRLPANQTITSDVFLNVWVDNAMTIGWNLANCLRKHLPSCLPVGKKLYRS